MHCENGGRAHLHWPPLLKIVEDMSVEPSSISTTRNRQTSQNWQTSPTDPPAPVQYKQYRKDGRTMQIDEQQTLVKGDQRVRLKCHAATDLSSPVVREYEWIVSAASCNNFELANYVRKCVQNEDAREAVLPLKQRKAALKLPESVGKECWRVFYTERASADESIQLEGELRGPVTDIPIWDVLPETVALHLFPNDQAGPEEMRVRAESDRLLQKQLVEVKRARALERQKKLARMYPEQREKAIREFAQQEETHQKFVEYMRGVHAAREGKGGASERLPTSDHLPTLVDPEKNKIVKGKGRSMYEALHGEGLESDGEWLKMKEERSGDNYWWNPLNGAISWQDPAKLTKAAPDLGEAGGALHARVTRVAGRTASSSTLDTQTSPEEQDTVEAMRGIWQIMEDPETSETDLRVSLQRLKPRSRAMFREDHRIV